MVWGQLSHTIPQKVIQCPTFQSLVVPSLPSVLLKAQMAYLEQIMDSPKMQNKGLENLVGFFLIDSWCFQAEEKPQNFTWMPQNGLSWPYLVCNCYTSLIHAEDGIGHDLALAMAALSRGGYHTSAYKCLLQICFQSWCCNRAQQIFRLKQANARQEVVQRNWCSCSEPSIGNLA